jgi:hypothetical protein
MRCMEAQGGQPRTAGQEAERVLALVAPVNGPGQRRHLAGVHALLQQRVHVPHLRSPRLRL